MTRTYMRRELTGMAPSSLRVLALTGFTMLLMLAAPATAQTQEQKILKGVTEVQIGIEHLSADDTRCGISEALLNAAATKALLDNGVRIRNENETRPRAPTLYLNVTTLYFEAQDACVTNVAVDLYTNLYATPPHSPTAVFGYFEPSLYGGIDSGA